VIPEVFSVGVNISVHFFLSCYSSRLELYQSAYLFFSFNFYLIRQGAVFAMEKLMWPPYFLTLVCLHPYFVTWIWHWTYSVCSLTVDSIGCNIALRAVATVVKMEDDRRLFHNSALRKRRKEVTENMDAQRRNGSSKVHNSLSMPRVSSMILRYLILWAFNRRIVRWD
jgi:isopentenyldiphosphate isomerase